MLKGWLGIGFLDWLLCALQLRNLQVTGSPLRSSQQGLCTGRHTALWRGL